MGRTQVHFVLFLAFISLPAVRSVTCMWSGSIESEGACFKYNSTALSYSDAKDECQSKGGVLARVTSRTQLDKLDSQLPHNVAVWIGANDIAEEGSWVWGEGGAPSAVELAGLWLSSSAEPGSGTDEDCATLFLFPAGAHHKRLTETPCTRLHGFLCMEEDPSATTITKFNPATTKTAASTTEDSATYNTAAFTTEDSATNNTAASTTEDSATNNTAASTTEDSATNNTAASTTEDSATNYTASSTTEDSSTTKIPASTTGTSATTNTAALTTDTSATALTTSTQLTTSTTPQTATTVTTTTNSTTNPVLTSTSTAKDTTNKLKKNGANFIDFNALLLFNLYGFNYLMI